MKTISFSIPCYNEVDNVELLTESIIHLHKQYYQDKYLFSIEFIDNNSVDGTKEKLIDLCKKYPNYVKVIFNARNFGGVSSFYGLLQTTGECAIILPCDFQIPLEIIPFLIEKWEARAKVVCAVKCSSNDNKLMWKIRRLYYNIIQKFSPLRQIENFTGSGLYDKSFIEWLKKLNDPTPSLRGMVAEYGWDIEKVYYNEEKRRTGKSKHNFISLFNVAIKNMINYTQLLPHMATFFGVILSVISVIVSIIYMILKFIYWDNFLGGIAPILFGVFFIGGVQLAFLGFMGEYLMLINQRLLNRPLVIESQRINFEKGDEKNNEVCKN